MWDWIKSAFESKPCLGWKNKRMSIARWGWKWHQLLRKLKQKECNACKKFKNQPPAPSCTCRKLCPEGTITKVCHTQWFPRGHDHWHNKSWHSKMHQILLVTWRHWCQFKPKTVIGGKPYKKVQSSTRCSSYSPLRLPLVFGCASKISHSGSP